MKSKLELPSGNVLDGRVAASIEQLDIPAAKRNEPVECQGLCKELISALNCWHCDFCGAIYTGDGYCISSSGKIRSECQHHTQGATWETAENAAYTLAFILSGECVWSWTDYDEILGRAQHNFILNERKFSTHHPGGGGAAAAAAAAAAGACGAGGAGGFRTVAAEAAESPSAAGMVVGRLHVRLEVHQLHEPVLLLLHAMPTARWHRVDTKEAPKEHGTDVGQPHIANKIGSASNLWT